MAKIYKIYLNEIYLKFTLFRKLHSIEFVVGIIAERRWLSNWLFTYPATVNICISL